MDVSGRYRLGQADRYRSRPASEAENLKARLQIGEQVGGVGLGRDAQEGLQVFLAVAHRVIGRRRLLLSHIPP